MMGSYNTLNEANILPNSIHTCITLYRNIKERPFDFLWGVGGKITLVLDFFIHAHRSLAFFIVYVVRSWIFFSHDQVYKGKTKKFNIKALIVTWR